MRPLDILITNNTLADRAGSELYVRDLALCLKHRGHRPVAYSQIPGAVADELTGAEVPVLSDLAKLDARPDIIHGQHHLETMTALLRFPDTPGIFCCHGYVPWQEQPPVFPRLLRYIAVDHACRDRLHENGIAPERVQVIFNFADLKRFKPRAPLPARPKKALVFSNYAGERNYLPVLRQVCARAGISLHVAGLTSGRPAARPETLLPQYDLVFAKARAAIEALAVGCAVITCDATGFGAMVTTANLQTFRELNFGFRTLTRPMDPEIISRELGCYNAADAQEVSRRLRQVADMETAVDQLLDVYERGIAEFRQAPPDRAAEEKAAAAYLANLAPFVKSLDRERHQLKAEKAALERTLANERQQPARRLIKQAWQTWRQRFAQQVKRSGH